MKFALLLIAACAMFSGAEARIHRDYKAVRAFAKANACPSTGKPRLPCPGYVVDHVIALHCGGLDHSSNLQWQTKADAKAKDKWERKGCKK